ncbi:MAG: hypothetical protein HQL82_09935 [Magnetococcales bacterium]|nr:hypothetical protein [Magnetococcales bacterium]
MADFTKQQRELFLEALRRSPNVSAAARVAGLSRPRAYELRSRDPEFARLWQEALDEGLDRVEEQLFHLATGEQGSRSVSAAVFWLKAHRPAIYKDAGRGSDGSATGESPLQPIVTVTIEAPGESSES